MEPKDRLKRATKRYSEAKAERDQAIREAASAGMTRRAIAAIVGVSHQRVQQIIKG